MFNMMMMSTAARTINGDKSHGSRYTSHGPQGDYPIPPMTKTKPCRPNSDIKPLCLASQHVANSAHQSKLTAQSPANQSMGVRGAPSVAAAFCCRAANNISAILQGAAERKTSSTCGYSTSLACRFVGLFVPWAAVRENGRGQGCMVVDKDL
jgi:hypothetical protein